MPKAKKKDWQTIREELHKEHEEKLVASAEKIEQWFQRRLATIDKKILLEQAKNDPKARLQLRKAQLLKQLANVDQKIADGV